MSSKKPSWWFWVGIMLVAIAFVLIFTNAYLFDMSVDRSNRFSVWLVALSIWFFISGMLPIGLYIINREADSDD